MGWTILYKCIQAIDGCHRSRLLLYLGTVARITLVTMIIAYALLILESFCSHFFALFALLIS